MFHRQTLVWFESKIDQVIYRNNRPFPIKNEADARYCHALQDSGFQFSTVPAVANRPRVVIGEGVCISCEG